MSLRSSVVRVGDLFGGNTRYWVPEFQREFSWRIPEVLSIVTKLVERVDAVAEGIEVDNLFFGSIIVLRPRADGEPHPNGIVDGQQRMLTLLIVLAVLSDRIGETETWLEPLVRPAGAPRLLAAQCDRDFMDTHVLRAGATLSDRDLGDGLLADALAVIRDELSGCERQQLVALANFIRDRCELVLISTDSIDNAIEVFTATNTIGRPLTASEVLRTQLLAAMPRERRAPMITRWNEERARLGEAFERLPGHVQMIEVGRVTAIVNDLLNHSQRIGGSEVFLDRHFFPAAQALYLIDTASHSGSPHSARINVLLRSLNLISSREWVPPLLAFLLSGERDHDVVATFVKRFEALAYGLLLGSSARDRRLARYRSVIRELRDTAGDLEAMPSLDLTASELKMVQNRLMRDPYSRKSAVCKAVLMRLSGLLEEDATAKLQVTVEHVLPLNPLADSQWLAVFRDPSERVRLTKALGNLVLVTEEQNRTLKNKEFAEKRAILFPGGQPHPFAVTNEIWARQEWTAETIRERQADMIDRLNRIWPFALTADL